MDTLYGDGYDASVRVDYKKKTHVLEYSTHLIQCLSSRNIHATGWVAVKAFFLQVVNDELYMGHMSKFSSVAPVGTMLEDLQLIIV